MKKEFDISKCPIGKKSLYHEYRTPNDLFAIPRDWSREKTFMDKEKRGEDYKLPSFMGADIWNCYEFTWINLETKKRELKFLRLIIPSDSVDLIESKSLKLYLFSLANTYATKNEIIKIIKDDCEKITKKEIKVYLYDLDDHIYQELKFQQSGKSLDQQDLVCKNYQLRPEILSLSLVSDNENQEVITETLQTNAFKANCLVTGEPDWASLIISYKGQKICHQALYKYLVSFRDHQGIHEQCIERILIDLYEIFSLEKIFVQGNFTRRGGLDINPIRHIHWGEILLDEYQWERNFRQ